ncbi:hypothetical protein FOCG_02130 [Fusarium oxysporum f. sp. radicis-lycopersici 26381]|uniref:DUF7732 domain-containing protein n=3 Tax=Fusarium oxysporum TaxID=5507 RepID=A0A2H3HV38_FUSOX|nr:hypothetical protein FOZG_07716 [Fusarium oxysporum Fo47]EWZ99962.1 hypothetical protein FOWG_00332 [Fusarium oxysporum f. sp. lycopersici MN25]EXL58633.1 hypothetical protein FOCG_02130 [Fusarium oxysporum f. sp. radicis-lycopersici 26381]KAJ4161023.1 hypothetical protein NW765_005873 [Fusarium oxysporum]PCD43314.1 hypothetical protein AU210_002414 [Fusarium oxysporum f. sp. radicis-cucumerinum]RYC91776.1 hypothetical protein BFJ63_vAg5508 [Fusarium oxysporum f. sp. narcissi]
MRPDFAVVLFTLITSTVASAVNVPRHIKRIESQPSADEHELYKRRGGGGGGARGGSSGGGSRGSSGSGSRGSSGGGGGSRGVGPQPSFAGGRYYPGGSSRPYKSGGSSPGRIAPYALGGAALAFWPGVWLYGAYMYPYSHPYHYHNDTSDEDEERDVLCGCSRYEYCACDDNNSTQYFDELIGNGSYDALNKSIVNVAEVNGTMTILINGTLPNDTALPDENASDNGAPPRRAFVTTEHFGWVVILSIVMGIVEIV